jgi:hypothetical protein
MVGNEITNIVTLIEPSLARQWPESTLEIAEPLLGNRYICNNTRTVGSDVFYKVHAEAI